MVCQNTESVKKIFVPDNNIVSIECPICKISREVNVSEYIKSETLVRFKVKCSCGDSFPVLLERREFYRKDTSLKGTFIYSPKTGPKQKGSMTVLDISRGGIKLKTGASTAAKIGDSLEVEFNLDNQKKSLVKKLVMIRNVKGCIINAQFSFFDSNTTGDKDIGFYLF